MIVTKDALRNTNWTLIFELEDNLQPAPMAEETQSAQRGEKPKIIGLTGRMKIKIEFSFELIKGKK